MRTLYLDIGQMKSASNARQWLCYTNTDLLKNMGFCYPVRSEIATGLGHHQFCMALCSTPYDQIGPNPPAPKFDFSQYFLLLKELTKKYTRILLSSHYFENCVDGTLPYKFSEKKIKQVFALFDEIKVIFYITRPDNWLISAIPYNTLTNHKGLKEVSENIRVIICYVKTFHGVLDYFADFAGKDNIIVRPLEKTQLYKNNLFDDYLKIFNIEKTNDFILPDRDINASSKDMHGVEIMRLMNSLNTVDKPHWYELRQFCLEAEQFIEDKYKHKMSFVTPEQCFDIFQETKPYYDEIAKKYLGREEGQLFVEPLPDINEPWEPYPGLSPEVSWRYLGYILGKHQQSLMSNRGDGVLLQQIHELQSQIKEQKEKLQKLEQMVEKIKDRK